MKLSACLSCTALLLLAGVTLCSCTPSAPGDEEKEQFFLAGKNRVTNRDFTGAVESFEKAVEVNPRSGPAHFELGWLYDQKEGDPAAAIYHYERFLKLSPNSGKEEMVKTRILACKQQLAQTVSLGPVTERQQRELEQLVEENKRLREDVEKWRAYVARLQGSTNPPPAATVGPRVGRALPSGPAETGSVSSAGPVGGSRSAVAALSAQRNYTVKAGETPIGIARKNGVKLEALMAANPKLDPKRMHVGQTLVIPFP
jgi:tetratricopeptide (TPR) repeat protein